VGIFLGFKTYSPQEITVYVTLISIKCAIAENTKSVAPVNKLHIQL